MEDLGGSRYKIRVPGGPVLEVREGTADDVLKPKRSFASPDEDALSPMEALQRGGMTMCEGAMILTEEASEALKGLQLVKRGKSSPEAFFDLRVDDEGNVNEKDLEACLYPKASSKQKAAAKDLIRGFAARFIMLLPKAAAGAKKAYRVRGILLRLFFRGQSAHADVFFNWGDVRLCASLSFEDTEVALTSADLEDVLLIKNRMGDVYWNDHIVANGAHGDSKTPALLHTQSKTTTGMRALAHALWGSAEAARAQRRAAAKVDAELGTRFFAPPDKPELRATTPLLPRWRTMTEEEQKKTGRGRWTTSRCSQGGKVCLVLRVLARRLTRPRLPRLRRSQCAARARTPAASRSKPSRSPRYVPKLLLCFAASADPLRRRPRCVQKCMRRKGKDARDKSVHAVEMAKVCSRALALPRPAMLTRRLARSQKCNQARRDAGGPNFIQYLVNNGEGIVNIFKQLVSEHGLAACAGTGNFKKFITLSVRYPTHGASTDYYHLTQTSARLGYSSRVSVWPPSTRGTSRAPRQKFASMHRGPATP